MQAELFIRKPFVVQGFQVKANEEEDNLDAIAKWCLGQVFRDDQRPFVRVPVDRPTTRWRTEAYDGCWVILSVENNSKSFKVYTMLALSKHFIKLDGMVLSNLDTTEIVEESELDPTGNSCCGHPHHRGPDLRPIPTPRDLFKPPAQGGTDNRPKNFRVV